MRRFSLALAIFLLLPQLAFSAEPLTVSRVVDGDILQLSNGETVALKGVDTPESSNNFKLWRDAKSTGQDTKDIIEKGKEAAEFTRKLVEGKQVRLEYDAQKKDKYGRTLAYVYVLVCNNCDALRTSEYEYLDMKDPDESNAVCIFLNATLVKAGYAQVMTLPSNVKYQELFEKLEKEAKDQKRGLWWDMVEVDQKKVNYKFGIEDATGLGNVRTSNAKVGADYKVSKNATVGVEASQGIHDTQDAAAWGQSVDDETAAQAKYKLSF
jgi:endonuclease YncB( thermonuclease family)